MSATAGSWKCEPFTGGVPLSFSAHFSDSEFVRLQEGLIPAAMEDKWFVYYEQPHLFFHRSWTGLPVYRVALETKAGETFVTEALWATNWAAAENADPSYQAKLLDFLVSNLLLGQSKPFPRPDTVKESMAGVFQHHAAGTGYRETVVISKKRWWRLW
jgi:hypothetical protein